MHDDHIPFHALHLNIEPTTNFIQYLRCSRRWRHVVIQEPT